MERTTKKTQGFTLIELVVTIVIMTLLVGIAVPAIGGLQDDAKVAKILQTAESAKSAAQRYYVDTSKYPYESSWSTNASGHRLSEEQTGIFGWNGPYLDRPLMSGDNPFGGAVVIYPTFNGGTHTLNNNEFRLTGANAPARKGDGSFIAFDKIPEKVAQEVDAALDSGISGDWKLYGRVQWKSDRSGTLLIYLCQN